jgi:hypothetical protein
MKSEFIKVAKIINDIRLLSDNTPTQDGRDQGIATADCIAYGIAADVLKSQADRDEFLKACNLKK